MSGQWPVGVEYRNDMACFDKWREFANIFYINNLLSPMIWRKKNNNVMFYSLLTNVTLEQPPNWTKSACFADKWVQYIYSAKHWRRIKYARCIDWGRDIRYAVISFSLSFSLSPLLDIHKSLDKYGYFSTFYSRTNIYHRFFDPCAEPVSFRQRVLPESTRQS